MVLPGSKTSASLKERGGMWMSPHNQAPRSILIRIKNDLSEPSARPTCWKPSFMASASMRSMAFLASSSVTPSPSPPPQAAAALAAPRR
eukprot:CAMPEP_0176238312 /NCGR_PEP_ID=MMETSP0121_2-20121125/28301_1 /TAXON_ID=160619 /ORGANISM="Kryptoperidinium foliaceum, Strain CCMP 1326" /LENGTH=88 /DNA_ID=CAMNT_0017577785 /DNA_START=179 /DNA_END=443 /DNA_ORIENTATION=+